MKSLLKLLLHGPIAFDEVATKSVATQMTSGLTFTPPCIDSPPINKIIIMLIYCTFIDIFFFGCMAARGADIQLNLGLASINCAGLRDFRSSLHSPFYSSAQRYILTGFFVCHTTAPPSIDILLIYM